MCMQWDGEKQNRALFEWYQALIALRKESPSLYEGDYETILCNDERNVYAFRRQTDTEGCIVLINAGDTETSVQLPTADEPWSAVIGQTSLTKCAEMLCAELPAYSVNILKNQKGANQ